MQRTRRLPVGYRLLFLALATLAVVAASLSARHVSAVAGFTPGNLVVYRVGTGTGSLVNTGNPVFLDEYTPAGSFVQSIALPTTASGGSNQLVASGTATSEGLLTRSADGRYLVATGYASNLPGSGSLSGLAIPRTVGLVDSAGNVDTSTALNDFSSGNNPRSAASSDGTSLWIGGGAGGVRATTKGGTTSTQLSTTVTNIRQTAIFNGQLYASDSSGSTVRLGSVGSGLPTTTGQTIASLPGFPTSTGSPYSFFFADLSGAVAGLDTLYVADDAAGLQKYSLVAGSWTANGTATASAIRGLTGVVSGTTVTLYGTTGGSGATGGGSIYSFVDSTGYNATISGTATVIATAATNTAFRGIALAPQAVDAPPTVTSTTPASNASGVAVDGNLSINFSENVTVTGSWFSISCTLSGAHTAAVSGGLQSYTLNPDTDFQGNETCTVTILASLVTDQDGTPDHPAADYQFSFQTATPGNTAPTISAIPALSGQISDPTNWSVGFSVGDAETAPAALTVTAAATTNSSVAPLGNVTFGGSGANRTVTVNPTGVGYADITIQVSDGSLSTTSTLHYAASAASTTPATSRFHAGSSDASTAQVLDSSYMLVGDDENQGLRLYSRTSSGLPVSTTDFSANLALPDSSHPEVDIEASARAGNRIYWMGSESNSKEGNSRPNRSRVFATDLSGSGAGTTLTYAGRYDNLKTDLINWDHTNAHGKGVDYYGLQASAAAGVIPETADGSGYNIEGLEFAPGSTTTAYIGFRAPISPASARTRALIVPVTNFDALIGGAGPATFGAPIELDLGGRGIREIRKNGADQYVVIAGPADSATGVAPKDFRLYSWDGQPASAPVLRAANLTALSSGGSFESIVEVPNPLQDSSVLQLINDNGDTNFYGDGQAAKDLTEPNFKKSRSDLVTLGAPVLTLRIHDIQGATHISPYAGKVVSDVPGIVTARRSNGFYLQDPTPDANDATSEGIFVFTSSAPPSSATVGNSVTVTGTVSEFRAGGASGLANLTQTELDSPTVTLVASGQPLPAPVVIGPGGRVPPTTVIEDDATGDVETSGTFDPANDGIDFWESLEGMRVELDNAVATGPMSDFGSNREVPVLAQGGLGDGPRTPRGGIILTATDANPERIILNDEISGGPTLPAANVGDTFPGAIIGVMDYNFANFKLQVTNLPALVSGGITKTIVSVAGANDLSIATFNVQNLDPTDPPAKFATLAGMIVNNLRSPDVITIEEIQDNNGETAGDVVATTTWNTLIAAVATAGGPTYQFRQIDPVNNQDGGAPDGNIRQGFLFRTDHVGFIDRPGGDSTTPTTISNVGGVPQLSASPGRIDPGNAAWTSSRKPLAGEFTYNGHHLFVIGNHFNSKGGDQPLFGHFQPPTRSSEVQRHQQAQIVHDFVASILAIDANADVVVLGDLNDFEFSDTVHILEGTPAILFDMMDTLPANERYSYVFEGNSQTLDHITASDHLRNHTPFTFQVAHVNSEFADQASDHDPSVVRFTMPVALCAPGTYSATGQQPCVDASAGNFVAGTGSTSQTPCLAGTYQPATAQTSCIDATAGHFVPNSGSSTQTDCAAGTYQPGTAQSSCIAATPGHFVPNAASAAQTDCPAGTYQPGTGQSSCIDATPGHFVPNAASAAQTDCAAGTYQPSSGQTACVAASPGHFVAASAGTAQTDCPAGTYQPNSSQVACLNADAGHFVSSAASAAQTPCPAGKYQPNTGQVACLDATPGHFAAGSGNVDQTECALGTYQPNGASASCLPADANFFVDQTGASAQTACPAGTFSAPGASACAPLPDTTILTHPTDPSGPAAEFTFSANVSATFECRLDVPTFSPCSSPATYSALTTGSHTFSVRANDGLGHVDSTPDSFTWTVDATPPDTTITAGPASGSTRSSGDATFQFTSTEAGTFECRTDGGGGGVWESCTSPWNVNALLNGLHTFDVRAIDGVGNFDPTPASRTWTVNDTSSPGTTITSAPRHNTNSSDATFTFRGHDGTSGLTFECRLDPPSLGSSNGWGPCPTGGGGGGVTATALAVAATGSATYNGLSEGDHTFQVRGRDVSGHVDATPAMYAWRTDYTKPVITYTFTVLSTPQVPYVPSTWARDNVRLTASCADGGAMPSGIAHNHVPAARVFGNGIRFVGPLGVAPQDCVDRAGNTADPVGSPLPGGGVGAWTVKVDGVRPVCSPVQSRTLIPANGAMPAVQIQLNVSDNLTPSYALAHATIVSVNGDNGTIAADVGPYSVDASGLAHVAVRANVGSPKKVRTYTVSFQVTDEAGNTGNCTAQIQVR